MSKKKYFVIDKDDSVLFELKLSDIEEVNNQIDFITEFKKNTWAFKIIDLNFKSLVETTNTIFAKLSESFPNSWCEFENATIQFNRHFLNYLSSLNTFLDRQRKYLSTHFGKKSNELSEFDKKTSHFFDNYFSYRLFYQLRNYTVHSGFSILSIHGTEEIINDGKTKRTSYTPYFLKEELLKKGKFGAIVTPELENKEEKIKVFDLVHESINNYKELNNYVLKSVEKKRNSCIKNIREAFRIKSGKTEKIRLLIKENEMQKVATIPSDYLN